MSEVWNGLGGGLGSQVLNTWPVDRQGGDSSPKAEVSWANGT